MNRHRLLFGNRSFKYTQARIERIMKTPYGICMSVVTSVEKPKPVFSVIYSETGVKGGYSGWLVTFDDESAEVGNATVGDIADDS